MPDEQEDPGVAAVERLHNPHNIRRMPDGVVVADCPVCQKDAAGSGLVPEWGLSPPCSHCNGLGVVQVR